MDKTLQVLGVNIEEDTIKEIGIFTIKVAHLEEILVESQCRLAFAREEFSEKGETFCAKHRIVNGKQLKCQRFNSKNFTGDFTNFRLGHYTDDELKKCGCPYNQSWIEVFEQSEYIRNNKTKSEEIVIAANEVKNDLLDKLENNYYEGRFNTIAEFIDGAIFSEKNDDSNNKGKNKGKVKLFFEHDTFNYDNELDNYIKRIIGALICLDRIRNNMFHGLKGIYSLDGQKELFKVANLLLDKIHSIINRY